MMIILGEDVAESYDVYKNLFDPTNVYKWWACPMCKKEFRFTFDGRPPWPPLDLQCLQCHNISPIPWSQPHLFNWKCERCNTNQMVSRSVWESQDKKYVDVNFHYGNTKGHESVLTCLVCGATVPGYQPPPKSVKDVVRESFFGTICSALEVTTDIIDIFKGSSISGKWSEKRELIERFARDFDNFFYKKIPLIRYELERIAEEEKCKIAIEVQKQELEAQKLKKEYEIIRKQAKTATGLRRMTPINFEFAVASLYLKLGYEVFITPYSGDEGIDLIITKNKARIAVQCKRYTKQVPVGQVRDFYGSFLGMFDSGIFVTSSGFSMGTIEWVRKRQNLELLNGQGLVKLFVEHDPKIIHNFKIWK